MAAIEISRIEVLVLKKLVLVNYALAQTLGGNTGREQASLVGVLNDVTLRADLANNTAPPPSSQDGGQK